MTAFSELNKKHLAGTFCTPAPQYLHVYPMHSPPKAINLSRTENKAVITYQENRNSGKDHKGALEQVKEPAARLQMHSISAVTPYSLST